MASVSGAAGDGFERSGIEPAVVPSGAMLATVIIVTDRKLFPPKEGSRARIVALILALREAGLRVTLVVRREPGRFGGRLPALRPLVAMRRLADRVVLVDGDYFHFGDPRSFDPAPYAAALERLIARERPAAVIAEYLWLAPVLDRVPRSVLRAVDTHDVMHLRTAMYSGQPEGAWVECSREVERELLSHADVVLAIQPTEAELFREMLPDRHVLHVPHGYEVAEAAGTGQRPLPAPPGEDREPIVAFVGSRIQGNVVGMTEFLRDAWPAVRRRVPGARLRLYGDVVSRLDLDAPGVEAVGYVESLEEVYAPAAVVINPVRLGTGLKIKSVEALAHGCALVTTPCGADGLGDGAGTAFLVAETMAEMGGMVARLLEDRSHRQELGESAREYAAKRFSRRAAVARLVTEIRNPNQARG